MKPGNILVDRAGNVKVLDLGLARFFHDQSDPLTQKFDETTLGTADYIAPEQVNDSHAADTRADLYALGGTFYFLLTGRPPFHDGTVPQKLVWHQTREPIPATEFRPDIPSGVAAIVVKLMAKNPADRYQTPAELLVALAPWVRTPVPPPAEEELPKLSPAATLSSSGRVVAAARTRPSPTAESVSPRPIIVTDAMPTVAARAVLDPAAVWSAVAAETRAADGDTGSTTGTDPTPRRASPIARPKTLPTRYAVVGGLALVVATGLTLWAVRAGSPKTTIPTADAAVPTRLYVTKGADSPDKSQTFASLASAVAHAKPNDTVVLLDPTWEEAPIRLNGRGKNGIRNLTIESESPVRETVWHAAESKSASEAVLELVDTPNVVIRGLTIHAGGTHSVGLAVVGSCPGLEIDRVAVAHATKAGIQFTNVAGDPDAPITLSHFRVVAAVGAESGVAFRANPALSNKWIRLSWGRIEGPGKQAILFEGPLADVEISTTRLFNWDAGVTLGVGLTPDTPFQLALTSNTFYGMKAGGLRVDGDIPLSVKAHITVKQNYFAKSSDVVTFVNSKRFNLPGLHLADNARDKGSREGKISFKTFEVANSEIANTDPDSEHFLRYPLGSKLAAAGPNKVPVGVPPE